MQIKWTTVYVNDQEKALVMLAQNHPQVLRSVAIDSDSDEPLAIPKLKIDLHIPDSGDPVTTELTAPAAGEYEIACSEFCGRGHAQMKAALVSISVTRTDR